MTPEERFHAFMREQTRQLNAWNAERRAGAGEVMRILGRAEAKVQAILKNSPSEWQSYHYPQLKRALEKAMEETALELKAAAELHQGRAFAFGQASCAQPLLVAGFAAGTLHIDTRQISAMRHFMTGKMEGITQAAARKINDQMGLVMAGAQSPAEAINNITAMLHGDRGRALTVMRTEIGRAYSVAAQEGMEASSRINPAMKKQWRKSGKLFKRPAHEAAHGQIRNIKEPFDIGGEALMFPRDPEASLKNTINCGCLHYVYMDSWEPPSKP